MITVKIKFLQQPPYTWTDIYVYLYICIITCFVAASTQMKWNVGIYSLSAIATQCPLFAPFQIAGRQWAMKQQEYDRSIKTAVPVLEETQSLMGPDADETLHIQRLQGPQSLTDSAHPARHFTRAVHVVRLHVLGESLLQDQTVTDHLNCRKNG